jgi:hypothetical protein
VFQTQFHTRGRVRSYCLIVILFFLFFFLGSIKMFVGCYHCTVIDTWFYCKKWRSFSLFTFHLLLSTGEGTNLWFNASKVVCMHHKSCGIIRKVTKAWDRMKSLNSAMPRKVESKVDEASLFFLYIPQVWRH